MIRSSNRLAEYMAMHPEPHKLIILGDLFDRGPETVEKQRFILELAR